MEPGEGLQDRMKDQQQPAKVKELSCILPRREYIISFTIHNKC